MSKQVTAVIRHFDEPRDWATSLAAELKPFVRDSIVLTDSLRLKTYDKAWLWLSLALRIDCDVLLHSDCDCVVRSLDLSAVLDSSPAVLAGPAIGSSITFSTGFMAMNRSARLLLLSYLETYKPTFCVYGRYDKFSLPGDKAKGLVASVDSSFSRLCGELGIRTVLDPSIAWRHRWSKEDYECAKQTASVLANVRGQNLW